MVIMKKIAFLIVVVLSLNGCATYHPHFPSPGEQVNPYDQNPVPDDGAASVLRDIIRNK